MNNEPSGYVYPERLSFEIPPIYLHHIYTFLVLLISDNFEYRYMSTLALAQGNEI